MESSELAPISIPGRVVVFDYGEVISLTPSEEDRDRLLSVAEADADAFWPAYWRYREALDEGSLGIHDYWGAISDDLGVEWPPDRVHQLWVTDYTSWLSINIDTTQIIDGLAAGGTRLALLSNAGRDFASFFRFGSLGPLFEHVFVSGELGLVKPDAAIYEHVLDQLGIVATQMVFVDNRPANVRGAEALGITTHLFTSAGELRRFLTELAD
ncbi:HAD family hydrolase [Luethyella okanaganae]|uniref:HAD family hydrolase n=1 Tax=Luethyella okanaganae TaxID=69372 RepID=A0ABW1VEB0_9MICO